MQIKAGLKAVIGGGAAVPRGIQRNIGRMRSRRRAGDGHATDHQAGYGRTELRLIRESERRCGRRGKSGVGIIGIRRNPKLPTLTGCKSMSSPAPFLLSVRVAPFREAEMSAVLVGVILPPKSVLKSSIAPPLLMVKFVISSTEVASEPAWAGRRWTLPIMRCW